MIRNIAFVLYLFIFGMFGCKPENQDIDIFKFPVVINTQIIDTMTSSPFEADCISQVFPRIMRKFKFSDTIDINPEIKDTSTFKDYIFSGSKYYDIKDSINSNGFELFADYNTSIFYDKNPDFSNNTKPKLHTYFPVYIVNSTKSDKLIRGKDNYFFGIQEAVDTKDCGFWKPIESRGFDFCGNGYWYLIVHPKEFLVVLMKKYKGEMNTKIRVRFKILNNTYVSSTYMGNINEEQFLVKENTGIYISLKKSYYEAKESLFYGAKPPKVSN